MAQQSHPRLLHVVDSFSPAAGGTTEGIRKLAQSSAGNVELVRLEDPREAYLQGQSFPVHALGPAKGSYRFSPRLQPWLKENLERLPRFPALPPGTAYRVRNWGEVFRAR